jgi:TolB protein
MLGKRLLTVAAMVSLAAGCTTRTAAIVSPVASVPGAAPTPVPAITAGDLLGAPIDLSTLRGRIVFSSGVDDIWVVQADGSGLARLTTNPAQDFDPSLSPEGTMVAFRSQRDGDDRIYVMSADGSRQRGVSHRDDHGWGPAWSPDGRVTWNCVHGLSIGFRACVANADGSRLEVLPIERSFEYGAWSPDGSKIAFMSQQPDAAGSDPNYDIFVVNADGSGLRQLTDTPGEDGWPSWSPDGSNIAFSSSRDDCSNSEAEDCRTTGDIGPYQTIYVMNADGSDQHRLSLQFGMFTDWSPDGSYLVFSPGLNVIRPDGTGLTHIPVAVSEPEFADWGP